MKSSIVIKEVGANVFGFIMLACHDPPEIFASQLAVQYDSNFKELIYMLFPA